MYLTNALNPAIGHAIGISFDDYAAGVLAYLDPAHAGPFEGRHAWNELSSRVVAELEALR